MSNKTLSEKIRDAVGTGHDPVELASLSITGAPNRLKSENIISYAEIGKVPPEWDNTTVSGKLTLAEAIAHTFGHDPVELDSVVNPVRLIAANRTQYATGVSAVTQPFTSRRTHYASPQGDISNLQTVDINAYLSDINVITDGPAYTIKRYIEYPVGVFTQVTWNGATSIELAAGARVTSDPVNITIPMGSRFWERTVVLTDATVPVIVMPAGSSTLGLADGNSSSDAGNSGTISATSSVNTIGCQAILGNIDHVSPRSFVLLGDSLTFGTNDITNVGVRAGSGWVARMIDGLGYPYTKWAIGGQQATDAVTLVTDLSDDLATMGFTDAIFAWGLNDLRLGRTKTELEADMQTLYTMTALNGKSVWQTTLTPRTTSTDGYVTTTNQTAKTDGTMSSLNDLNADIRAVPSNVTDIVEAADAFMSARDSDLHKAPPAGTTDGTHPTSTRAALVASLAATSVDVNADLSPYPTEEWLGDANTTLSWSGSRVRGTATGTNPRIYRKVSGLTIGSTYHLYIKVYAGTLSGSAFIRATTTNALGSGGAINQTLVGVEQDLDITFTAGATTEFIGVVGSTSTVGQYFEVDDIFLVKDS